MGAELANIKLTNTCSDRKYLFKTVAKTELLFYNKTFTYFKRTIICQYIKLKRIAQKTVFFFKQLLYRE